MPLVDYILKVERDHPDSSDRRPGPRTRRQTLVADSAPQPARPTTEAAPSRPRQSAHHRHQHSLVPVTQIAQCNFDKQDELRPQFGSCEAELLFGPVRCWKR